MNAVSIPEDQVADLLAAVNRLRDAHLKAAADRCRDFHGVSHPGGFLATQTQIDDARIRAAVEWDTKHRPLAKLRLRLATHRPDHAQEATP